MTLDLQEYGFKQYTSRITKPSTPSVRINANYLWLSVRHKGLFPLGYCLLFWKPETKQIAIRPAAKNQEGAIKVCKSNHYGNTQISATQLIRKTGVLKNGEKSKRFKTEWDEKFRAILIDLKEEL
jgi:hypothetical protein